MADKTAEQIVKAKHPNAFYAKLRGWKVGEVFASKYGPQLGDGKNKLEAWENASKRLKDEQGANENDG